MINALMRDVMLQNRLVDNHNQVMFLENII